MREKRSGKGLCELTLPSAKAILEEEKKCRGFSEKPQDGGIGLKKRNMWIARASAVFLSAALIGGNPGVALARENQTGQESQTEQTVPESRTAQNAQTGQDSQIDETDQQVQNGGQGDLKTEEQQQNSANTDAEQNSDEKDTQTEDALQKDPQTEDGSTDEGATDQGESQEPSSPEGEEELPSGGDTQLPSDWEGQLPPDWEGQIPPEWEGQLPPGWEEQFPSGGETELPTGPITVVLPMDSGEEYEQLSQFLTLSSDQFAVYTVAFIDPMTGMPVQPEEASEVSLTIPAGYDMDRVVVSEITMEGETPVRTELPYTNENNSAVIKTDHAGLYVVMEKKVQPELPSSLKMTDKVAKLELTKKLPSSLSYTPAYGTNTRNPQTGDDTNVMVWVGVAAAAVVIIVAAVLIIRKRR